MRSFRLSDAQCFSDADRDAILRLVGRWWTEQTAGELDGLSPSSAEARSAGEDQILIGLPCRRRPDSSTQTDQTRAANAVSFRARL